MPILHARLPDKLANSLGTLAKRRRTTPSHLARHALETLIGTAEEGSSSDETGRAARSRVAPLKGLRGAAGAEGRNVAPPTSSDTDLPTDFDRPPGDGAPMRQLNLWLTEPEDRALRMRAKTFGTTRPGYVGRMVRAHLAREAQLDRESLVGLRQAVRELAALGRNLNQVAHHLNSYQRGEGPNIALLRAVMQAVTEVQSASERVTQANVDRWVR